MKVLIQENPGPEAQVKYMLKLRWLMWGIPALVYVISYFHRVAPTIVASDLMAAFNTSGAALGYLGAVYFYVYAIMQIPSGFLADTLGPRKTAVIGTLIGCLGSFVFGAAATLWVAYLGRFLVGLGFSLIFICILKIAAEWFRDNQFGTLTGLTLLLGSVGALTATKPLSMLVTAVGWRMSFHTIGAITLVLAAAAWLLVRDRPSHLGLPSVRELEAAYSPPQAVAAPETINFKSSFKEIMGNKGIWPTVALSFGMYGTLITLQGMWVTPYLTQVYGISREEAATYVFLSLLAGLLGPLLIGYWSDSVGRRKLPMILLSPLYFLLWLVLAFWNGGQPPLAAVPVLLFFLGIFCSPSALTWACAKEVSRPALAGMATGLTNMGGFLGAALMQPIFGYILDSRWNGVLVEGVRLYPVEAYRTAFIFCALVSGLSTLCIFLIRETNCRNIFQP